MKDFFKDIFEYHHHFNQKLTEQLIDNKSVLPPRTIPLFSHAINAHQIWNARITTKEKVGVHQVRALEACKRMDEENYHETMMILEARDLEEIVTYANSNGNEFANTISQILFHIVNHFSHHKGQIISDVRHSGISPIVTDYIFYKR